MPYCSNPTIRMGRPLQSSRSAVTLIANGTIAPTELEHTLDSLVRVSRRVGHISITAIVWQHMCIRASICAYSRTCFHTCADANIANDYMYTKKHMYTYPGRCSRALAPYSLRQPYITATLLPMETSPTIHDGLQVQLVGTCSGGQQKQ